MHLADTGLSGQPMSIVFTCITVYRVYITQTETKRVFQNVQFLVKSFTNFRFTGYLFPNPLRQNGHRRVCHLSIYHLHFVSSTGAVGVLCSTLIKVD